MRQVESLLEQTNVICQAKKLIEQTYNPLLAPRFSPVRLFHPQETDLSRILAELLDPHGTHAQGCLFLDAFIRELVLNPANIMSSQMSEHNSADIPKLTSHTQVDTEYSTSDAGRFDIILRDQTTKSVVVIENKPWASDGNNQLFHYANYLAKSSEDSRLNWLIVYLSDTEPSINSIDLSHPYRKHIVRLDFVQLGNLLLNSSKLAQAPSVRTFVESFAKYLFYDIAGKPEMTDSTILSLACRPENIEATKLLYDAYPNLLNLAWKTFGDTLSELSQDIWKGRICVKTQGDPLKRFSYIEFAPSAGNSVWAMGFEAQQPRLQSQVWGVYILNPKDFPKGHPLRAQLQELFNQTFGSAQESNWWPWYRWGKDGQDESNTEQFFPINLEESQWLQMMLEGKPNLLTSLMLDKVKKIFPVAGEWPCDNNHMFRGKP